MGKLSRAQAIAALMAILGGEGLDALEDAKKATPPTPKPLSSEMETPACEATQMLGYVPESGGKLPMGASLAVQLEDELVGVFRGKVRFIGKMANPVTGAPVEQDSFIGFLVRPKSQHPDATLIATVTPRKNKFSLSSWHVKPAERNATAREDAESFRKHLADFERAEAGRLGPDVAFVSEFHDVFSTDPILKRAALRKVGFGNDEYLNRPESFVPDRPLPDPKGK